MFYTKNNFIVQGILFSHRAFSLEPIHTLLPNPSYGRGCSLKWIALWTGAIFVIHRTHTHTGDALVSLGETEGQLRSSSQPIVHAVEVRGHQRKIM